MFLFLCFSGHNKKYSQIIDSPTSPTITPQHHHHHQEYEQPQFDSNKVDLTLQPCPNCTRTFIPETLLKHIKICEKMTTKKRKKFDSQRQRIEGTDLALLPPKPIFTAKDRVSPPRSVQPHRKSIDTIQQNQLPTQSINSHTIKRNSIPKETTPNHHNQHHQPQHQHQQTNHHQLQPIKATKRNLMVGPIQEQCPHCERCFGMKAYDRHVEWCKEKMRISNPQNSSTLNVAKERLQARTKYRAPPVK